MQQPRLVASGSFCWNPACPHYAQVGHSSIIQLANYHAGTRPIGCPVDLRGAQGRKRGI